MAVKRRRVTRPRKIRIRKPPRAARSRFWSHRGRRSSSTFRAHKPLRHRTSFRAHGKRGLAAHPAKHPKARKAKAHKPKAHKKATVHTVASHRCGQPLHHTSRKKTAHRKTVSHRTAARHLSKAERERISKALKGHHAACACKTAGSKKHKARSHHHLSVKTRARISAKLHAEHAGAKWGKAVKGPHRAATSAERVRVLKAAKRASGKSKAAARKPC